MTKICSKCKKPKEESEFYKKGNKLESQCKQCRNQYYKEHNRANRGKIKGMGDNIEKKLQILSSIGNPILLVIDELHPDVIKRYLDKVSNIEKIVTKLLLGEANV